MTAWDDARAGLAGQPGGGINIAVEAVDRHVTEGRGDVVALRFVGRHGERSAATFAELSADSGAFADLLGRLGIRPGEAVFTLLGRVPELYVAALGTWKARAVLSPLFSAFGPEPVAQRLQLGRGRVLVTTEQLYRRKVAPVRERLPELEHVLLVDGFAGEVPGGVAFGEELARGNPAFVVPRTDPEDPALLHFTSGTTGTPKGAVHVHEAVVAHAATAAGVLGLRRGDVYWCTADPGWVTGTSYGIIAPLVRAARRRARRGLVHRADRAADAHARR